MILRQRYMVAMAVAAVLAASTKLHADDPPREGNRGPKPRSPLGGPQRGEDTPEKDGDKADGDNGGDKGDRQDGDSSDRENRRRAMRDRRGARDGERDGEGMPPPEGDRRGGHMRGGPGGPGGPDGPDWMDGPEGFPRRLSPEQVETAIGVLRQHMPEMADRLQRIRDENPDDGEFFRRVRRLLPMLARIVDADPEMRELLINDYRIQMRIDELSRQLRRGEKGVDRDALLAELRPLVAQQFDIRIRKHERILDELTRRIEKQRADLEHQKAERDGVIDRRIEELAHDRPPPGFPE